MGWADLVSPLAISKENAEQVQVLLDEKLVAHSGLLAFHPSDAKTTVFIPYEKLHSYLVSTGVKLTNVHFVPAVGGYDSPRFGDGELMVVRRLEKQKQKRRLQNLGRRMPRLKELHSLALMYAKNLIFLTGTPKFSPRVTW